MKKHYTSREMDRGEMAVRRLSEKAQNFYANVDIGVRGIEKENGIVYDVVGMYEAEGLTLDELNAFFEELNDIPAGDMI